MFAVVRVRGSARVPAKARKTLELLMLDRVNHMVLAGESQRGMLNKVQSYVTFGEIGPETLAIALEKRGREAGNKRLGKAFLEKNKFKDFGEAAKAVIEGKKKLREIGVKPVFRLSPPKKGYERAGIKKGYSVGGALGYRASDINKLVKRMV